MRKKVIPKLRPFLVGGIGDCDNAKGHTNLVLPEQVQEMIALLIESLPNSDSLDDVVRNGPVKGYGEFTPERCKKVPFTVRCFARETRQMNARVRWVWGTGWQFTFYPYGLNERTIIHEVAHLPSWGCGHNRTFKFWMTYLTEQWFGGEKPLIKDWKMEVLHEVV